MARPKNLVVVSNGKAVSVTPKNLKTFLEGVRSGTPTVLVGKDLGTVTLSLEAVTQETVGGIMSTLFPEPVRPVTAEGSPEASPEATVAA